MTWFLSTYADLRSPTGDLRSQADLAWKLIWHDLKHEMLTHGKCGMQLI